MFFKTHLIITLFFVLIFIQNIENQFLFLLVAVFATALPDIDSHFSFLGKRFKIFNFFLKHRGIVHSFTFLFAISILLFMFWKEILFPFVFGYSLHLFFDAITLQGIFPFYPFGKKFRGFVKTGGLFEKIVLVLFFLGDLFLLSILFNNIL